VCDHLHTSTSACAASAHVSTWACASSAHASARACARRCGTHRHRCVQPTQLQTDGLGARSRAECQTRTCTCPFRYVLARAARPTRTRSDVRNLPARAHTGVCTFCAHVPVPAFLAVLVLVALVVLVGLVVLVVLLGLVVLVLRYDTIGGGPRSGYLKSQLERPEPNPQTRGVESRAESKQPLVPRRKLR
jgi:hypothetical protein